MKKFLKNDLYILITLLCIVLLFKYNIVFKECILLSTHMFFTQVFPTLLPMFIINDILISYNFINYLEKFLHKIFHFFFSFSNAATYIFTMSIFSGTPTNGYIAANLVKNKHLNSQDASIILSYSFFLNPLFLYSILSSFLNKTLAIQLILIAYGVNIFIALHYRKYKYQDISLEYKENQKPFSNILKTSIEHAFLTLVNILGTMIFYFVLCEGINIFLQNPTLNCIMNGFLEITGGLSKLNELNTNLFFKELLAIQFISFGGLSIHSQIKGIITDANISYRYFFKARIIHMLLSTLVLIIIS